MALRLLRLETSELKHVLCAGNGRFLHLFPLQQGLRVKELKSDVGLDSFTVFDLPRSASSIDLLLGIRHRLKLS